MYSKHGFPATIPGGQKAFLIFLFTSDCNNNQVDTYFNSYISFKPSLHQHGQ